MMLGLAMVAAIAPVMAQDEEEGARRAARADDSLVREVVRGFYLKSNIGTSVWLATDGVPVSGVMALGLGVGSDFIDRERFSAAWEIQFGQGLFHGPAFQDLPSVAPVVEGDIHTFSGTAVVEVSGYVSRRTGFGARGGGGVLIAPLLITQEVYENELKPAWGGADAAFHAGPLPLIVVGGTFEYYTKLSHFSVGADVDAQFLLPNFYVAVVPTGYLKYTF